MKGIQIGKHNIFVFFFILFFFSSCKIDPDAFVDPDDDKEEHAMLTEEDLVNSYLGQGGVCALPEELNNKAKNALRQQDDFYVNRPSAKVIESIMKNFPGYYDGLSAVGKEELTQKVRECEQSMDGTFLASVDHLPLLSSREKTNLKNAIQASQLADMESIRDFFVALNKIHFFILNSFSAEQKKQMLTSAREFGNALYDIFSRGDEGQERSFSDSINPQKNKSKFRVIYVDKNSTANRPNGQSWKTAYKDLSVAFADSTAWVVNEERKETVILIASGEYSFKKTKNYSLDLNKNFSIYGGIDPQSFDPKNFPEECDPQKKTTIKIENSNNNTNIFAIHKDYTPNKTTFSLHCLAFQNGYMDTMISAYSASNLNIFIENILFEKNKINYFINMYGARQKDIHIGISNLDFSENDCVANAGWGCFINSESPSRILIKDSVFSQTNSPYYVALIHLKAANSRLEIIGSKFEKNIFEKDLILIEGEENSRAKFRMKDTQFIGNSGQKNLKADIDSKLYPERCKTDSYSQEFAGPILHLSNTDALVENTTFSKNYRCYADMFRLENTSIAFKKITVTDNEDLGETIPPEHHSYQNREENLKSMFRVTCSKKTPNNCQFHIIESTISGNKNERYFGLDNNVRGSIKNSTLPGQIDTQGLQEGNGGTTIEKNAPEIPSSSPAPILREQTEAPTIIKT